MLGAEVMLEADLASGRLVRVLLDYQAPLRPIDILFAASRYPNRKLRSFVDTAVAAFGP
jgi:DNA-binding transcriptional LysR family regulator